VFVKKKSANVYCWNSKKGHFKNVQICPEKQKVSGFHTKRQAQQRPTNTQSIYGLKIFFFEKKIVTIKKKQQYFG